MLFSIIAGLRGQCVPEEGISRKWTVDEAGVTGKETRRLVTEKIDT
jgi:hypothetical protein